MAAKILDKNTLSTDYGPPIFGPPEPWNLRIIQDTVNCAVTLDSWETIALNAETEGPLIKAMKFARQLGEADANGAIGQNWRGGNGRTRCLLYPTVWVERTLSRSSASCLSSRGVEGSANSSTSSIRLT